MYLVRRGYKSYVNPPHHVVYYDARKPDGTVPHVILGKYTCIASHCVFVLHNHSMDRVTMYPAPYSLFPHGQGDKGGYVRGDIVIGNDVWIGAQCMILDGVTIGDGAVCAARSVVTRNVPPYAVVAGHPARVIKYRFDVALIPRLIRIDIWNRPNDEIDKMDLWTSDIERFIQTHECAMRMENDRIHIELGYDEGCEERVRAQLLAKPAAERLVSLHWVDASRADAYLRYAANQLAHTNVRITSVPTATTFSPSSASSLARLGYSTCSAAEARKTAAALGFVKRGTCDGEDMIIAKILEEHDLLVGGWYVDVGCGPHQFSNTANLADYAGWRGLCVDVLPDFVAEMRKVRGERCTCVEAYVSSEQDAEKTIVIPNYTYHRRFTAAPAYEWRHALGSTRRTVRSRTLWSILEEHVPPSDMRDIRVLNVTCEGEDAAVLQGARIEAWKPLIVCILFKTEEELRKETDILAPLGYTLRHKKSWIALFVHDRT